MKRLITLFLLFGATGQANASDLTIVDCIGGKSLLTSTVENNSLNTVILNLASLNNNKIDKAKVVLTDGVTGESFQSISEGTTAKILNLPSGKFSACPISPDIIIAGATVEGRELSSLSKSDLSLGAGILGVGAIVAGVVAGTGDDSESSDINSILPTDSPSFSSGDDGEVAALSSPSASRRSASNTAHSDKVGGRHSARTQATGDCNLDEEPPALSPFS